MRVWLGVLEVVFRRAWGSEWGVGGGGEGMRGGG